jgi:osmotically inducible lipoprotein OsmB
MRSAILATTLLVSFAAVPAAVAQERTITGAAIGAGVGAVVAGPPGAIAGGAVGAVVGGPRISNKVRVRSDCVVRNGKRYCR